MSNVRTARFAPEEHSLGIHRLSRDTGNMLWRILLLSTLAVGVACGPSSHEQNLNVQALIALDKRLEGSWRLTSYMPREHLGPQLLSALGTEQIVVKFRKGRLISASPLFAFDRQVHLRDPVGENFRAFIRDEQGIAYEVWCQFDQSGRLLFDSRTSPWKGTGVLESVK